MESGRQSAEAGRERVPVSAAADAVVAAAAYREPLPQHSSFRPLDSQLVSRSSPEPSRGQQQQQQQQHQDHQQSQQLQQQQLPQQHSPSNVWSGAIARLQTQVSYNTGLAKSNRRDVERIDGAVNRLQHDLQAVFRAIDELRHELRSRPPTAQPSILQSADRPRLDPGDAEVLAEQIQNVANKANEVDGLKMQVELLKRRLRRMEDGSSSPALQQLRPGTASSLPREQPAYETHYPPQQPTALPQGLTPQPLPPMRTAPQQASPAATRAPAGHSSQVPILPSAQTPGLTQQLPDARRPPGDAPIPSTQPSQPHLPGFRPVEPLPGPAALSSWRPADSFPAPSAPQYAPRTAPLRSLPADAEASVGVWASVNPPAKRPAEAGSGYQSPTGGSPKRPRLAPIMPRSTYGEEGYRPPAIAPLPPTSDPRPYEVTPLGGRTRTHSNESLAHIQPSIVPAGTLGQSFRFVASANPPEEAWRAEAERAMQSPGGAIRGRGRHGARGVRRSRAGEYGVGSGADAQEQTNPEYEREPWGMGVQVPSTNGYSHPMSAGSPISSGGVRNYGAFPGAHSDGRSVVGGEQHEFPATPVHGTHGLDAFASVEQHTGSSKKTRTKPVRNADGVLIRKDGRPDMRSVSSANNLRKVHAKKEAERQVARGPSEQRDEEQTPTSVRSIKHSDVEEEGLETPEHGRSGTPAGEAAPDGVQGHRRSRGSSNLPSLPDDLDSRPGSSGVRSLLHQEGLVTSQATIAPTRQSAGTDDGTTEVPSRALDETTREPREAQQASSQEREANEPTPHGTDRAEHEDQ